MTPPPATPPPDANATGAPTAGSAPSPAPIADFSWPHVLGTLIAGRSLSEAGAAAAMGEIMKGDATAAQIAGFVVALRVKGEAIEEIVGLVRTMRSYGARVEVTEEVLDTCGTGGDRAGTFNVSTAAALVCAGAGVPVAKHGNRAASSRCGSADVLEALGVRIDLPPEGVARCITEAGIGFCFAPIFHPAMRYAGPPRKELGVATIFNFLGPLTNPAGATHQALGVADAKMLDKMVDALARLGSRHVVAFHGEDGLDELSTSGPSRVLELKEGRITEWIVEPQQLGLPPADLASLAGGSPQQNAQVLRDVLEGQSGPHRDIVVLNAAAGLMAADRADSLEGGIQTAAQAIDSGRATRSLDRLIEVASSV
ncbi:MAG: anthranilate phosphoribosyltransferase [Actinomycetota bacterium]|jgi:anthranilate phosphoribosyltransferase|nr:anthranilate phosphoribosyltransferase [Actinomycetota bacterium]